MKIYCTNYSNDKISQNTIIKEFDTSNLKERLMINIYPEVEYNTFLGFGGALTEAAAYAYSLMNNQEKEKFIEACYGESGLGYKFGRLSVDSCDFALGNYCAKQSEDSEFTLENDERYILPLLRDVEKTYKLRYMLSPWSPPAYMKDTKERNKGGKLLPEYYQAWAEHFCTYIEEYIKMGFDISCLSVQNEPNATQRWDSCIYTPSEEAKFLSDFLYPEMKKRGLDGIARLVWDHNRERLYERLRDIMAEVSDRESVSGVAYHWYSGDHFENIRIANDMFPNMLSVFSEGCVEYSHFGKNQETVHAEKYAYNILNCLKNGCNMFLDWNVLLDSMGGPNHVGNFCAAPIMLDSHNNLSYHSSYYAIASFSKYIKQGAVRLGTSSFTDELENVAFKNPNGEIVIVLLNRREYSIDFNLRMNNTYTELNIPAKSIYTIVI